MKTLISLIVTGIIVGLGTIVDINTIGTTDTASNDVIVSMEEWNVPFDDSRSRDPYVAPNGTVYFAGQRSDYIGNFNPITEEFREYPLEDGAGPHTVVVAEGGTVWYTGNRARHIGKLDPETGEITKYMMEDEHARDPHTFAIDKNGNLWFTAQGGNGVGHFNTDTGETHVISVPTERARPYGIRMAPDQVTPWVALFGTNKLATVDPETMELTEIELPREETRPRRLDVTTDGNIWYGDYAMGKIGRYNPEDGSVEEWDIPQGEGSRPYAVLADHKDRIWLGLSGPDPSIMTAFDTETKTFVASREIPSGDGSIRHMDFAVRTNALWFGTDTGHIGRIMVN
ncbi:Vgb family protein [Rhodohalobacter sp. 8-1]|uniref:Vgb family protein n=1 Tax=Rhodohalobacter sp. 8-1 TaxID=3131972 RepID=UPI0030ECFE9B